MSFKNIFETDQDERDRLAQAPVGSMNHDLSLLPVTFREVPGANLLRLPNQHGHIIVVLVIAQPGVRTKNTVTGLRRRDAVYSARIVASDHDSYPVGGHDISIPEAQVRRSQKIDLAAMLKATVV